MFFMTHTFVDAKNSIIWMQFILLGGFRFSFSLVQATELIEPSGYVSLCVSQLFP